VEEITRTASAGLRPLVLVADDDAGIRHLVATVLHQMGLSTWLAMDGAAAVQMVAERVSELCCVILDVRMPVLDGMSAAQAIREIAPDMAIVLMSAAFPSNYAEQIAPLRIAHVLDKPFPLDDLRAVMRPFLRSPADPQELSICAALPQLWPTRTRQMAKLQRVSRPNGHLTQAASPHSTQDHVALSTTLAANATEPATQEHQLLAAFPAMLFTCRPDGAWGYISPSLCAYTGRPAEALSGLSWVGALHADDRAAGAIQWQHRISHGTSFEVDQRLRGADGTHRWFRTRCAPQRSASGTIERWAGITTLVEPAQQGAAEQAQEQLAQIVRDEQSSVVATAAHELRTPLTVVLGQARLLQRRLAARTDANPGDQRSADTMVEQALRLAQLISALLDAAHIDHGQLLISATTLDLGALVRRVVQALQPTLPSHTLRLSADEAPLWIAGDAIRLEQVLHNLLQNAVKYSPAGSEIVVLVASHEYQAQIAVRDQGIGIAARVQPALFQRFFRANTGNGQAPAGLGIGLYICKAIIDLHGGSIAVESAEGAGSTFTLHLPRLPLAPPDSSISSLA
jgi:signal transduction histidine kinase/DNA-binding response OmpR family regulator